MKRSREKSNLIISDTYFISQSLKSSNNLPFYNIHTIQFVKGKYIDYTPFFHNLL